MQPETMYTIPEAFAHFIAHYWQVEGAAWIARLPALLAEYEQRWAITLGQPFDLSFNYVAAATRADGTQVVLKAGVPRDEIFHEIAALHLYDGTGSVRLLDADAEAGVMLLERVFPGTTLFDLVTDDEQATTIAADVMRRLWKAPLHDHQFPSVADWVAGLAELRPRFGGTTGSFPARLVEQAEQLFAELLPSQATPVVLHGDLHHWNILADGDAWRAIDPKGVIGEPAYEVGALLRNPVGSLLTWAQPERVLQRRVDLLVDVLGFERERVIGWALAQAVLSAWWDVDEQGTGGAEALAIAEICAAML